MGKGMRKRENVRTTLVTAVLIFALAIVTILPSVFADAAGTRITVPESEYDLAVSQLPDGVTRAYAKLHDSSLNASEFELALFDGYEALVAMEEALEGEGEDIADINYLAMETILYQSDEEGDFYPVEERMGLTLICPIPSSFAGDEEKVQITAVNDSGKLQRISSELVEVNGVSCMRFDVGVFGVYAFLVKSSGTLTSGSAPTPTPTPRVTQAPTSAPTSTPVPSATQAPTSAPTPTVTQMPTSRPTQAPTSAPTPTVTQAPTSRPTQAPTGTPTPTKTPTSAPTKAPTQSPTLAPTKAAEPTKAPTKAPTALAGTNSGGSSSGTAESSQPVRDRTPQTGDGFDREGYLVLFAAGVVAFAGILVFTHRKK